jgi:hypothetical protein
MSQQHIGDIQHCTLPVVSAEMVFLLLLRSTEFWALVFTWLWRRILGNLIQIYNGFIPIKWDLMS